MHAVRAVSESDPVSRTVTPTEAEGKFVDSKSAVSVIWPGPEISSGSEVEV